MSERLPYEEQMAKQWDDLPLPDENMAWADMKRRLDEEEDRPFLPFWLRGCAGWGLLGLLLLGLGWWIIRPEKWFTGSNKGYNTVISKQTDSQEPVRQHTGLLMHDSGRIGKRDSTAAKMENGIISADTTIKIAGKNIPAEKLNPVKEKIADTVFQLQQTDGDKKKRVKYPGITGSKSRDAEKDAAEITIAVQNGDSKKRKSRPENNHKGDKETITQKDPVATVKQAASADTANVVDAIQSAKDNIPSINSNDSASKQKIVSNLPVKDTATLLPLKTTEPLVAKSKKDSSNKQPLEWSAGIGMQQQLPVAGQKWTPYNAQGRKGTLADYIPSVYVRLTRPKKWFLQAEFRYGAPQYTKEEVFRKSIISDTGSAPRFYFQNSSSVKKTYYHQLPLVFNYYLRPGWTVGAGLQWNRFYSAVAENERIYHDNIQGTDSVLSKSVQRVRADSVNEFKKSFLQGVVETQYKWRRFSFGARYVFGLQPYVEFTLPGAALQKEKLNSLQLFIRFELWKLRKKPLK